MLNRQNMKLPGLTTILVFLFITGNPAMAINKCVDKNGKVTFQDKSCPDATRAKKIEPKSSSNNRQQNPEIKVVDVVVNKRRKFTIGFPGHWQYSIETNAQAAPTLRAFAAYGEPVQLLMTFLPKRQSVGLDDAVLNEAMRTIHDQHVNEKKIRSKKVDQIFSDSVGHVFTYVDESLVNKENPAEGEFSYLTTGAVVIEGMLITITILSNNLGSENYAKAMVAIHTIVSN